MRKHGKLLGGSARSTAMAKNILPRSGRSGIQEDARVNGRLSERDLAPIWGPRLLCVLDQQVSATVDTSSGLASLSSVSPTFGQPEPSPYTRLVEGVFAWPLDLYDTSVSPSAASLAPVTRGGSTRQFAEPEWRPWLDNYQPCRWGFRPSNIAPLTLGLLLRWHFAETPVTWLSVTAEDIRDFAGLNGFKGENQFTRRLDWVACGDS